MEWNYRENPEAGSVPTRLNEVVNRWDYFLVAILDFPDVFQKITLPQEGPSAQEVVWHRRLAEFGPKVSKRLGDPMNFR